MVIFHSYVSHYQRVYGTVPQFEDLGISIELMVDGIYGDDRSGQMSSVKQTSVS